MTRCEIDVDDGEASWKVVALSATAFIWAETVAFKSFKERDSG